ncbi:MAG: aminodeoxychorismate lyase [Acidiferrobacterales bacterium]
MNTAIVGMVNGRISDHISANDRGLQFGDGCFETIAVEHGRALMLDKHLIRLATGCERLGINLDGLVDQLTEEAGKVARSAEKGVLKIILTRGAGGRGYRTDPELVPTRILSLAPWPHFPKDYRTEGIAMRLCDTRLSENRKLAGIKHLNRLEQVLARSEWHDSHQEGLMLDQAGHVIEGTMSNIFIQVGNELRTPDLARCGVSGVMRNEILRYLSKAGIICRESRIDLEMVFSADALFVCNSLIGLWPVTSLDDKSFPITDRERELQEAIKDVCVAD